MGFLGFVDLLVYTKRKQILCERDTPVDNLSVIPVILICCMSTNGMYVCVIMQANISSILQGLCWN